MKTRVGAAVYFGCWWYWSLHSKYCLRKLLWSWPETQPGVMFLVHLFTKFVRTSQFRCLTSNPASMERHHLVWGICSHVAINALTWTHIILWWVWTINN